jgi:hypothetical protein
MSQAHARAKTQAGAGVSETPIREYLQMHVDTRRQLSLALPEGFKFICPEEIVLKYGITPARKALSPWVGEPNNCFVNAAMLAEALKTSYYTEGYFLSVIPLPHAWVTLPDGTIYDPTLDDQARGADLYLGVPFTRKFHARHMKRRQNYPSVFIHHEMFDLDVLKGDFEVAKLRLK